MKLSIFAWLCELKAAIAQVCLTQTVFRSTNDFVGQKAMLITYDPPLRRDGWAEQTRTVLEGIERMAKASM